MPLKENWYVACHSLATTPVPETVRLLSARNKAQSHKSGLVMFETVALTRSILHVCLSMRIAYILKHSADACMSFSSSLRTCEGI
jgi:hypothetical protein